MKKKSRPEEAKDQKQQLNIWNVCESYSDWLGLRVQAVRLRAGDAGGSCWRSMFGSRLVQHVGGRIVLPDSLQMKEKAEQSVRKDFQKKRKGLCVELTMCMLPC